jgi:hypothetical protein
MTEIVIIAIKALAERTDPLITRINQGETLTNQESKQLAFDLYNLANMMKTAAAAVDAATEEIADQDKEIAIMKALLGLSDSEKAGK